MESNITRDHIALEVMKVYLMSTMVKRQTIWNKIAVLFFGKQPEFKINLNSEEVAEVAYIVADKMIKERDYVNEYGV